MSSFALFDAETLGSKIADVHPARRPETRCYRGAELRTLSAFRPEDPGLRRPDADRRSGLRATASSSRRAPVDLCACRRQTKSAAPGAAPPGRGPRETPPAARSASRGGRVGSAPPRADGDVPITWMVVAGFAASATFNATMSARVWHCCDETVCPPVPPADSSDSSSTQPFARFVNSCVDSNRPERLRVRSRLQPAMDRAANVALRRAGRGSVPVQLNRDRRPPRRRWCEEDEQSAWEPWLPRSFEQGFREPRYRHSAIL